MTMTTNWYSRATPRHSATMRSGRQPNSGTILQVGHYPLDKFFAIFGVLDLIGMIFNPPASRFPRVLFLSIVTPPIKIILLYSSRSTRVSKALFHDTFDVKFLELFYRNGYYRRRYTLIDFCPAGTAQSGQEFFKFSFMTRGNKHIR